MKSQDLTKRTGILGSSPKRKATTSPVLEGVRTSVGLGHPVFPLVEGGKRPAVPGGFKSAIRDVRRASQYFSSHLTLNYGIPTGTASGFFVVDVDGVGGKRNLAELVTQNSELPRTQQVNTPHGVHYRFLTKKALIRNSVNKIAAGIDVRGDGGYVVGPGSSTPDGVYAFAPGRGPKDVPIAAPPAWLLAMVQEKGYEEGQEPSPVAKIPLQLRGRARRWGEVGFARELERLAKAPVHQRNNSLNLCVFRAGQLAARGLIDHAKAKSEPARLANSIGLGEAEIERTIKSAFGAGLRSPANIPFVDKRNAPTLNAPAALSEADLTKELAILGETDTDNAERFARRCGDKVIFSKIQGWMFYDGVRYMPNARLDCVELAKEVARRIADEAGHLSDPKAIAQRLKLSKQSMSKVDIDRMLDLAKGRLVVAESSLDADPWLLNTETYTIDLRTVTYYMPDPRDLITKVAKVKAKPRSECPMFLGFLQRITRGDKDLCKFIQKSVGYSLTGITSEQVIFFVFGRGRNGKSTLINLIREMLGDYGRHTPTETILTKQYDNSISADLARLRGARMVTAVEANYNRSLDEAKLKALTGGEPTTARDLYEKFREFRPEFKLWMVANDRPRVRATDYAMWRRLRVIPLNVLIEKCEIDPKLSEKLRAELPGILSWAIRGCLLWQQEGLAEPDVVRDAASQWRRDANHVKRFFTEKIALNPNLHTPAAVMHNEFLGWCKQNGEAPMSAAELKTQLTEKCDLTHKRTKAGSIWVGVTIRT